MTPFRPTKSLPALRGAVLATCAAVLFGVSTPLVQRFGVGVGAFSTAALLYLGAAVAGAFMRRSAQKEARVRPTDVPRLLLMAALGAALGPWALAWGLQHTSAASASLMLSLEAVFTAILARMCYRETLDGRVRLGLAFLTLGGVILVLDQAAANVGDAFGLLIVAFATVAWALDNTLSRALADRDPGTVVMLKSAIGVIATAAIAWFLHEPALFAPAAFGLIAVGALGYGLSLHFYLRAQRSFGAARTGSVFALAPFIGALCAIALGERNIHPWTVAGAALMLLGVCLHLLERHSHQHRHAPVEHEHAHRHDDGHHLHTHTEMPSHAHSHWHAHTQLNHAHPHVPDIHHVHEH